MSGPTEKQSDVPATSRRNFLRTGAVVGGAALAGAISRSATAADADNLPPKSPNG